MCGIAGWIGSVAEGETLAKRMVERLRHRGPDAQAFRLWPRAGLVHARLSIIDLSPTGAQPMANEDGAVWTAFNGEIFNHAELRRLLEAKGHRFRGKSDTEILPHLYEQFGLDFIERLRGQFAWAIYDANAQTLLLARDRFGIKPLFYAQSGGALFFASELNALKTVAGLDLRPDRQAIHDYAALFYIPAPATFFTGIRALEPGQFLEAKLTADGLTTRTGFFHRWSLRVNDGLTMASAVERAEALVGAAVRSQLESDVPLGALLSGGIDSSLVSAAAQHGGTGQLRTFNVRFPDSQFDETWAARAVSSHIGSRHQTLDIGDFKGTWENITAVLRQAGQPFADTSVFAANAICQLMRREVTVALSGDGGDEGFGGYNLQAYLRHYDRLQRLPGFALRGAATLAGVAARLGLVSNQVSPRLREMADADDGDIMQIWRCWIRPEEHARLCRPADVLPVRRYFEHQWEQQLPAGATRLERLSALATEVDTRLCLAGDYLFKVDIASMKASLEVRVPMLDEELFAFGLTLPHALKTRGHECKRVLREVAARQLPTAVANKAKTGFDIPVDRWVTEDFKKSFRAALLDRACRLPEYFEPCVYQPIVEAFASGTQLSGVSRIGLYQRAIMLLAAHLALEESGTSGI